MPASTSVGQAAKRLSTTPRMLRYREALGLVSPDRTASGYRTYREDDMLAAALAAQLEARFDITPAGLAFALRALDDPELMTALRQLSRLARHPSSVRMLDFETRKAQRLLGLAS